MKGLWRLILLMVVMCALLSGCDDALWNDPYPSEEAEANTLYLAFTERPKHLDPARSYTTTEWPIIAQIYEPPLQYHYLKRPFVLEPLTATELPSVHYLNEAGQTVSIDAAPESVAYSDYVIHLKPGIYYQAHPAFAKDEQGHFLY